MLRAIQLAHAALLCVAAIRYVALPCVWKSAIGSVSGSASVSTTSGSGQDVALAEISAYAIALSEVST